MSVFQKPSGRWVVDWWPNGRHGGRKRKTLPQEITTEEDALKWEQIYRDANKEELALVPPDAMVKAIYPRYLAEHVDLYLGKRTASDVRAVMDNHVNRILGGFPLAGLSKAHLRIYATTRATETSARKKRPVTARTINKELAYISGFLTWCKEELHVDVQDTKIKALPTERKLPIVLTFQEVIAFLDAADPYHRALFGCLYLMGLRVDEARGLTWNDLDLTCRAILVKNTKGKNPRLLPVPKFLAALLTTIRPEKPEGLIFPSPHNPRKPFNDLRKAIERARVKAEISKSITPHLLRHTFATHLMGLNETMRNIQALLGHSRISTTEWYTHVAIDHLFASADSLDAAIDRVTSSGVYTLPASLQDNIDESPETGS